MVFSATDEPPKESPAPPPKLCPLLMPGASSATDCRSRSTGSWSISSRVTFMADSVEVTSTAFTMREPTTVTTASDSPPRSRSAVVATPRLTVTSGSEPRLLPSFIASSVYVPTGRNGKRKAPSASVFTVRLRPVPGSRAVISTPATRLFSAALRCPTIEPSPLAPVATCDPMSTRAGMQVPISRLKFMLSPLNHGCLERVIPLVEVQVAATPFDLATLRVHGVGAEVLLRRHERPAEIVIECDAVGVEAAEVEARDLRIRGLQRAEGHVHRHPAIRREVDLRPVVHVV